MSNGGVGDGLGGGADVGGDGSPSRDVVVVDDGSGGWVRVCRADAVPADRPLGVLLVGDPPSGGAAVDPRELGDRDKVCVVRDDATGSFVAMMDRCPHRDIRLSGGVVGDGRLTCPGHFWRFALTDGRRTDKPDEVATLYPTRVDDDGWLCVDLPPRPAKQSMREWLLAQARSPNR